MKIITEERKKRIVELLTKNGCEDIHFEDDFLCYFKNGKKNRVRIKTIIMSYVLAGKI